VSSVARSVPLRLIPAQPEAAVRRLHLLMRQRDALRPLFGVAWDNLAARFDGDELEGWAAGVLALADVNAGPSCLIAFWEISRSYPTDEGIAPLIVAAHTAANVCRHAGAQAAAATLRSVAVARRILDSGPDLALIEYGAALRLWIFGSLIVGLATPLRTGVPLADGGIFLAGLLGLAGFVGVLESAIARLRLSRIPQFLVGAIAFSVLALVLVLR